MKPLPPKGGPKLDLLSECNDPRVTRDVVPPEQFKDVFCKRCRNWSCVNAGWAKSTFEERINTQVDRLLINPQKAPANDPRFGNIRVLHFQEIAPALSIQSGDAWEGPKIHLAKPDTQVSSSSIVDAAVAQLAKDVTAPVVSPTAPEPVAPVPKTDRRLDMNTTFPAEGVMIGGGSVPPVPASPPAPPPPVDPWTPQPSVTVVPRGAKIKMGG